MKRFLSIFLLLFLLSGCAAKPSVLAPYAPAEENRLVIYTSHKEQVYLPIIREFEERTGIWVELVTGGTAELLEQIQQEAEAPKADILFGGGVETVAAYRDSFADYRSSEWKYLSENFRREDSFFWTPFSALPVVLIYNAQLVQPEMLTSWQDLSRPEFHGKVAFADPHISGSSFTSLMTCYFAGTHYIDMLAKALDGKLLSSSGDILTSVADGNCLVGVTLEETALRRIAEGANIGMVYPSDGTSSVPDGTAIVRNAPHEINARRFVDFTLSKDVQQRLGDFFYRRSVRQDIPADEDLPPIDQLQRVDYDAEWVAQNREALLKQWVALAGEAS